MAYAFVALNYKVPLERILQSQDKHRAYLRALEELAGCPLAIVSTGPDRDANIVLRDPWA